MTTRARLLRAQVLAEIQNAQNALLRAEQQAALLEGWSKQRIAIGEKQSEVKMLWHHISNAPHPTDITGE